MTDLTQAPDQTAAADAVAHWLRDFNAALGGRGCRRRRRAVRDRAFWRDLVAMTWNLKTLEGRDEMRGDAVGRRWRRRAPRDFRASEPPAEADGVIEAWLEFETAVGRGRGHLRLRDGTAWTLLTTLYELKGHEEPRGPQRPMGAEHGVDPERRVVAGAPPAGGCQLGYATQPEVVIIGGGQGGIALGARLRQLDVPTIVDRPPRSARRPVARPLQVAVSARPGLVRPPALPEVPGELAGVLAQGQDRRLAGDVHPGDGAQLLDEHDRDQRPL